MIHQPISPALLFMVTAPSGAGKSTLVNALLASENGLHLSVSHTTRAPRPGEVDGRHYHFVTPVEFEARRTAGDFLESALVHGHHYGTSRSGIAEQLAAGVDVVLEIDWQGARQLRELFPEAVGIFILPPSIEALSARLRGRATDSEAVIERRLLGAGAEIAHAPEFDFVIINEDFEAALEQLRSIVRAARQGYAQQARRSRQVFTAFGLPAEPRR